MFTNPFFAELTVGVQEVFDGVDYFVLLSNTSDKFNYQISSIDGLLETRAAGIILCPAEGTTKEYLEKILINNFPLVLVARYIPEVKVDFVGPNDIIGAEMAVNHLIQHGHKRIAYLGGMLHSSTRENRETGYKNALNKNGIEIDSDLIVQCEITRDAAHKSIRELLKLPNPPTAALCYNDFFAFSVIQELWSLGYTPGEDFAVVGYDDIAMAALCQPPLTTISISPKAIGFEAAKLLKSRIENPQRRIKRTIIEPELIIRKSCGCK